ncbi:hypothetical protein FO519_009335 [Halicephalobus sp. NKZ332]|nr:hypothetical protein FO519_009335 [Halicephalobus sp. NKZ332]
MAEQSLEDLREWPPQTILKLFELVRPYPILYDEKHKSWTNKTLKGHIWTTIAKCLDPHLTSRRCRDRFVAYRRRYSTEMRKQMARGEGVFDPKLNWLLKESDEDKHSDEEKENNSFSVSEGAQIIIKEDPTEMNDSERSQIHNANTLEKLIDRIMTGNQSPISQPQISNTNVITPVASSSAMEISDQLENPPAKKQKRKNAVPQKVSQDDQVAGQSVNPIELFAAFKAAEERKAIEEECSLAGQLIALDLRKLNPENRAIARVAISQILHNVLTNQLEQNKTV